MTSIVLVVLIGILAYYAGNNIKDGVMLGAFFSIAVLGVYLVLVYVLYFDFTNVSLPESFIAADEAIRATFYDKDYVYKPIDENLLNESNYENYSYIDDKLYLEIDLDIESKEDLDNKIDGVYDKVLVEVDTLQNSTVGENVSSLEKLFNSAKNMVGGVKIDLIIGKETEEVTNGNGETVEGVKYTIKASNVSGNIKIIYQSETMMGVWEEFESKGDFEFTKTFDSDIKVKIYQNNKLIYEKYGGK